MQTTENPVQETSMEEEILEGLHKSQKTLPSKYFYDERGSQLFEEICELDEYYPTNTEMRIMESNISEIAEKLGSGIELIEFGSGSSKKTRLLLNHLNNLKAYVPVDISRDFLFNEAERLKEEFPKLNIYPVAADYTQSFQLPSDVPSCHKVVYFPGSTIGNFTPERAVIFLNKISDLVAPEGGLLIGVDTKKDPEILEAAYNDSAGITAAFNKNLLIRLNRELSADFNPAKFRHSSVYNKEEGRIEMHLISLEYQQITVAGKDINFEKGETIHTENSYKYSPQEFEKLASDYFNLEETWTDNNSLFSVHYMSVL